MRSIGLFLLYSFSVALGGCNSKAKSTSVSIPPGILEEYREISISSGEYELILKSDLLEDSLSGEWEDDIYGFPVVRSQFLHFLKNGMEVSKIEGLEEVTIKSTLNNGDVKVKDIILFDLCLIGNKEAMFFEVSGSSFCHGALCPEYYAIFSLEGDVLCEQISTTGSTSRGQYESCLDIMSQFSPKIGRGSDCQSIMGLWRR